MREALSGTGNFRLQQSSVAELLMLSSHAQKIASTMTPSLMRCRRAHFECVQVQSRHAVHGSASCDLLALNNSLEVLIDQSDSTSRLSKIYSGGRACHGGTIQQAASRATSSTTLLYTRHFLRTTLYYTRHSFTHDTLLHTTLFYTRPQRHH